MNKILRDTKTRNDYQLQKIEKSFERKRYDIKT